MILVYGAAGYTGALVCAELARRGEPFVAAGRTAGPVQALAAKHGVPHRVFPASEPDLAGISVVLNCAGPFSATALPLARASVAAGAHYADLSGEVDEHEQLKELHTGAVKAGVMVLPGAGFGVVATEPLAALAVRRLGGQCEELVIAYETAGGASKGTLATVLPALGTPGVQRFGGELVPTWAGAEARGFDLGGDGRAVTAVTNPWRADLISAYESLGVQNISTYATFPLAARALMAVGSWMATSVGRWIVRTLVSGAPDGPSESELAAGSVRALAIATGPAGKAEARMAGPEAYVFTARAAAEVAARAAKGEFKTGVTQPWKR
ncbi:hypothetical protein DFJ74DRAFT_733942 [Hyaloraphidium curvatum]|nr:hypothetical protein DFJ74DRAFT_733942 [Hyaloraphidium curvatum]